MEFVIKQFKDKNYYIRLDTCTPATDTFMAEYLDLTIEEYAKILTDNRANTFHYTDAYDNILDMIGYEFKREEDAQRAIEVLTPYLVMANLTK